MKKFFTILIASLVFTGVYATDWVKIKSAQPTKGEISLVNSTVSKSVLEFNLEGFWKKEITTEKGEAWLISVEDGAPLLEKSAPDLPIFAESLIIPDQANMKVSLVSSEFVEYTNVLIAPSKGNLPRTILPSSLPYEYGVQYEIDADFPGELAELSEPYIIRDYRGQVVKFQPFQYNPVTKTLKVYYKIVLSVEESGTSDVNVLVREKPVEKIDIEFKNIYSKQFLNFGASTLRYDPVEEIGNMIVISYGDFLEEIQPLVDWKNQKGIPTSLVDVAEIGGSADIKQFIKTAYGFNGVTFVLLVGDNAQVPSSSVSGNDSDNDYTYVEGNDHYPDLFVGRFSAQNEDHVTTMVNRTLAYEKNPTSDTAWYTKAIGIASSEGPGDEGEMDYQHIRNIQDNKLIPFTYNYGYEFFEGSQGGNDDSGNPTPSMVSTAVNSGASIINYTGHGSDNAWSTSGFSSSNVNNLTNTEKWPFIFSVACVNGNFVNGTCFAEAWTRAEDNGEATGAIATIMSTINQSWNPPMCGQDEMNDILTEAYSDNIKRTFGGVTMNGCMEMNDSYGSSGYQETDCWTIFGDPSVVVRTDAPAEMTVSHPASITNEETTLTVECDAEGGMAALTMNNEIIAVVFVENGEAVFTLSGLELGTADLVVTAFNYAPYISTIEIEPAWGPNIVYNSSLINDVAGNNDGILDYNENILLTTSLENIGNEDATDITAELITTSEYVEVLNSTATFGQIGIGETVTVEDAFNILVADSIPDGYVIQFLIAAQDGAGRSLWESDFSIEAHAPVLSYTSYSIDDSDGDNNGKLDPGETADFVVQLTNLGSSSAYNVIGQLVTESEYLTVETEQADFATVLEGEQSITAKFEVSAAGDTPGGYLADFELNLLADYNISSEGDFMAIVGRKAALILNLSNSNLSSDTLMACFENLEVEAEEMTAFPEYPDMYKSIFVVLGSYPDQHVLTTQEGKKLSDFLVNGGNIYMEGGETWHNDNQTIAHAKFYIESNSETSNDLSTVNGVKEGFLEGYSFTYDGQADYIDHLQPKGDAKLLLSNADPYYGVAVSFENETYKTVGTSICFAGLLNESGSTKDGALADILDFFGVTHIWTSVPSNLVSANEITAYPNPFRNTLSIEISLDKSELVTIDIFDLTGRKIKNITDSQLTNGTHTFLWNAENEAGSKATPGIYFYSVKMGEKIMTNKIVLNK